MTLQEKLRIAKEALEVMLTHDLNTAKDMAENALAILNEPTEEVQPVAWQGVSGNLCYDKNSLLPSTRHLARALVYATSPPIR